MGGLDGLSVRRLCEKKRTGRLPVEYGRGREGGIASERGGKTTRRWPRRSATTLGGGKGGGGGGGSSELACTFQDMLDFSLETMGGASMRGSLYLH